MPTSFSVLCFVALLRMVKCFTFAGPQPTVCSVDKAKVTGGWMPRPTRAPSIEELRKRSDGPLVWPETCGWVDGDMDAAVKCSIMRTCMLFKTNGVGMAGCCEDGDTQHCGWKSSCVDYDAYTAGSCDAECERNTFIRVCSNSRTPYCNTWTYPDDNVADFGCTDTAVPVETIMQLATTAAYYSYSTSTSVTISLPTITDIGMFPSGTDLPSSGGGGSGGSGGSSSSSSGSSGRKKKVSIGTIVGAVIGGLFFLFIIAVAVIFLCVKRKKEKQLAANQQAVAAAQANRQSQYPFPQQQQQPPMVQQQQQPPLPMQPMQPQYNGAAYYATTQVQQDPNFKPQPQVQEYGVQSPVSNPSSPPTPTPAYVQPYYATPNAPPMPPQSLVPYNAPQAMPGAQEVDGISAPRPPVQQGQQGSVYEMGQGR